MGKGKSKKTHPKGKKASAAHPDVENTELPLASAMPAMEAGGHGSSPMVTSPPTGMIDDDVIEIVDSEVLQGSSN